MWIIFSIEWASGVQRYPTLLLLQWRSTASKCSTCCSMMTTTRVVAPASRMTPSMVPLLPVTSILSLCTLTQTLLTMMMCLLGCPLLLPHCYCNDVRKTGVVPRRGRLVEVCSSHNWHIEEILWMDEIERYINTKVLYWRDFDLNREGMALWINIYSDRDQGIKISWVMLQRHHLRWIDKSILARDIVEVLYKCMEGGRNHLECSLGYDVG